MTEVNKKAIDMLFDEKKVKQEVPEEVIEVIREIIKRNDVIGSGSAYRVSLARTVEWIKKEMNYSISNKQIQEITQKHLNRKSWARE